MKMHTGAYTKMPMEMHTKVEAFCVKHSRVPTKTPTRHDKLDIAHKMHMKVCLVSFHMFRSGKEKQHKHKLFGPDFPRTFLTLTPGRPWVKKFLPITGAAEKRTIWRGRPRFSAQTSMNRRVLEELCTKKFALII